MSNTKNHCKECAAMPGCTKTQKNAVSETKQICFVKKRPPLTSGQERFQCGDRVGR